MDAKSDLLTQNFIYDSGGSYVLCVTTNYPLHPVIDNVPSLGSTLCVECLPPPPTLDLSQTTHALTF